jgi:magnesium and cobalt transporter
MKLFNSKILQQLFSHQVSTRRELVSVLEEAAKVGVFDRDSLPLLEAVLQFGDMRAKDILLPRHEVDIIKLDSSVDEILKLIISTGHSRFPVVGDNINDVLGIFHSKDIVQYILNPSEFDLHSLLRQPFFVPDIKPIDALLYEMRVRHSHLAVVVDEFTNVAGIVTLEMIVEQIIGEIDDEHDAIDGEEHGVVELQANVYRVKGFCGLEQFNHATSSTWADDKVESVGGYICKYLSKIPQSGEIFMINGYEVEIIQSDSRKISSLTIKKMPEINE